MDKVNLPRLMLTGTGSGTGKTTVCCAVLQALINRGLRLAAFKCGPDYIDPMFHSEIIGASSGNLDLFLCPEPTVRHLFADNAAGADLSVIEGVMGMYDGLGGTSGQASSNHLAMVTATPEVLVVNARGMSLSAAAVLRGFRDFDENNLQGVIFNQISPGSYPMLKAVAEERAGLKAYGFLPPVPEASVGSRHLGLVTAAEIADLKGKMNRLAAAAEATLDLDGLLALARRWAPFTYAPPETMQAVTKEPVPVAVAMDRAFCFYYRDSLMLLERLGVRLIPFSPLSDAALPPGAAGLLLGGGYPEEYAESLAANASMRESVRAAVAGGLPTLAECGGFMYLQQGIEDLSGRVYPMAGVLPGCSRMTGKLSRNFGYITLRAKRDNLLCPAGGEISAHEFHYSQSEQCGEDFEARKGQRRWDCVHADENLFAGYPHLHLWGNPDFVRSFVWRCADYVKKAKETDIL